MMSLKEVSDIAPNRIAFYELLVRNRFYMPSKKSPASTLAWMYSVFQGRSWCPR